MREADDNPGVIAPPPLIAIAALVLGLGLDWLFPSVILRRLLGFAPRATIGAVLIAAGLTIAITAVRTFRRAGTNVEPWKPALALVTNGIFGWIRNPIYLALMLLLAGLGIALGSDWLLGLLVPAALILHLGVVKREEQYLERKFGESYRAYMRTVPRYWP